MKSPLPALLIALLALGVALAALLTRPAAVGGSALGGEAADVLESLPGRALEAFDLSTPEAAMASLNAIHRSADMRAMVELQRLTQAERLDSFEVVEVRDYQPGRKVLFVTFMRDGQLVHDVQGMKRLPEPEIWVSDYVSAYSVHADDQELAAAMEAWEAKGAGD